MTKFFKILFSIIILGTSISSLDAMACGKMKNNSEKKSCCESGEKEGCKSKKVAENQKKPKDCGGNCSHPSCKCWTLLSLSALPTTSEILYNFQFLFKEISISNHQVADTTAGFYSNWEPPKIG